MVTSALHSERCMAPLKYIARTSSARPPIGLFLGVLLGGADYGKNKLVWSWRVGKTCGGFNRPERRRRLYNWRIDDTLATNYDRKAGVYLRAQNEESVFSTAVLGYTFRRGPPK